MDIQAYIASGILESYVLGELPTSEARQVEKMAERYPEVRQELELIEQTLEGVAKAAAVAPRPALKNAILENVVPVTVAKEAPEQPLQIQKSAASKQKSLRWLAAASIALAVISSVAAVFFWSRWQETEERLASMVTQNTFLAQQVSTLENRAETMEQSLAVLADPSYKTIPMKGLAPAPNAQALVFWNPSSAEVYLNAGSLPPAPAGKQYQLWAIVEGEPVDAGVFDVSGEALKRMKEVQKASAFAVTLEPSGGSTSPTLDQMYVVGETS